MFKAKSLLALVLCFVMATTGCTSAWIKVALADLPVLVQMALNIATLVSTATGNPPSDIATIQAISTQANTDLSLLQTLYDAYQASPNATNLQKIQDAINTANQNLPALLAAAHIENATLSARVTAAVGLILETVNAFAALIPQPVSPATKVKATIPVPTPPQLKAMWLLRVGVPLQ